jgi:hypothetical protein
MTESTSRFARTTIHASRLFKKAKGHEAKLAYLGEVLMENRHGLVVDACVVPATGTRERDAAMNLVASLPRRRVTIGGEKAYDTYGFVDTLRAVEATPQIAEKHKSRTLDGRMTRHPGYAIRRRPKAERRSLRLGENDRRVPQVPSPRRRPRELAVSARRGGLQPGADAHAGGDGVRCPAAEVVMNARISASC